MDWVQGTWGAGLLALFAAFFLVSEFLVKARGLAGLAGLTLLVLYTLGQNPEWNGWVVALLALGLILVVLDGKLIQDGTLAVIGLLLMLAGLVIPTGDWVTGSVVGLLWIFGIICGFLSLKVLPRRELWDRIVLKSALTRETGYSSVNAKYRDFVGKEAVAVTDMRPTGTVEIDGGRYSAVSAGIWIKKGARLKVTKVEGTRILIEPLQEEGGESAD
ncbi:NfeD family protein [Salinithrix halophila]|uniref:NfeD family protein n=1 Tax=Salinithrix halophila TaxID=1485204 RepID=A0ABV8J9Z4_9BACL